MPTRIFITNCALLLAAACTSCNSPPRTISTPLAADSGASCSRAIVTVHCGELQRVDTRWTVATTIVKAGGESCSSYIDVPPDSTSVEIAGSIAKAIEAVCEVDAGVTANSDGSQSIELTGATFGDIQLSKFGRELSPSPEGDLRVTHKLPVAIDDQLTIRRVH